MEDEELFEEEETIDVSPEESTVEELRETGADPLQPWPVQHFLLFPMVSLAQGAARELEDQGYRIEELEHDFEEDEWVVTASHEMPVTVESLSDIRRFMTAVAEARGGVYDGWNVQAPGLEYPTMDESDVDYSDFRGGDDY